MRLGHFKLKIVMFTVFALIILYFITLTLEKIVDMSSRKTVLANMHYKYLVIDGDDEPSSKYGNTFLIYNEVQENGLIEVDNYKLNSSEYIGLTAPCIYGDVVFYDSYSIKDKSPCIIKVKEDKVELVTLKEEIVKEYVVRLTAHKVVKNNTLYYQSGNNIYAYDLLSGKKEILITDAEIPQESIYQFDVNDLGDIIYTSSNEKFMFEKLRHSNGDEKITNFLGHSLFYSNNEVLSIFGRNIDICNLDTGEKRTIARFKKEYFGEDLSISQVVLTPDKKQALVHLVGTEGKAIIYYYRILDIESGKSYSLNRGKYYSYPTWIDDMKNLPVKEALNLKNTNVANSVEDFPLEYFTYI